MREIEFRAWLKDEKKMVKVSELRDIDTDIKSDQNVIYFDFEKQEYCNKGFDEVELMQYTGLTDKNIIKIFEGDIVKFDNKLYEVIWENDECRFGLTDNTRYSFLILASWRMQNIQVIGNIYENSELLEVE